MLGFAPLSSVPLGSVPSGAASVTGVGAVTLVLTAVGSGEHQLVTITAVGAVTLGIESAAGAAHGVAGACDTTLTLAAVGSAAHGVAGAGVTTLTLAPVGVAVHQRYELTGEVRLGGILVNRRVRAYRRDTGAFVSEADTTTGRFKLPAGFDSTTEFTVLPIDLDSGATDFVPPVANRVLPELAFDA